MNLRSHRSLSVSLRPLILLALTSCGDPKSQHGDVAGGFTLNASGGTYSDGSGTLGLALLASIQSDDGQGPEGLWTGSLADDLGVVATGLEYAAPGPNSFALYWSPATPFDRQASYHLRFSNEDHLVSSTLGVLDSESLAIPIPTLSADGNTLSVALVPGALSYECQVKKGGAVQLRQRTADPTWDLSALPDGAYTASVLAFSADLEALSTDIARMPTAFHVSEGRLGFTRGVQTTLVEAVGGEIRFGSGTPGLVIWLRIGAPDGTPSTEGWSVEVSGPGISPTSPITFQHGPGISERLAWSYWTAPESGTYALSATSLSSGLEIAATFSVPAVTPMLLPTNIVAQPINSGSVRVNWDAVPDARSYIVALWESDLSAQVGEAWVTGLSTTFGVGTLVAGQHYSVYVAAASIEPGQASVPGSLSMSENAYVPVTFTAQ